MPTIRVFDKIDNFSDEMYFSLLPSLPPERRLKAERYRFMLDKKLCVIAYMLLGQILRDEYGIVGPIDFSYGEHGKPFLAAHRGIHFSLSHCKYGAACAVSDVPVGIDIQDVTVFDESVAKRVCSDYELAHIYGSPEPEWEFCRIWTRKESALKLWGTGISGNLKEITASKEIQSDYYECRNETPYIVCCTMKVINTNSTLKHR